MIYITGDTHGIQSKWCREIHPHLAPGDTVLVAGDFGIGFWGTEERSEEAFFDWLASQPYTVAFVDGNHENFDRLLTFPVTLWNGGRVHTLRPNLVHLMRGEAYTLEGMQVFVMGGGSSDDRYRRRRGISWWPEEMPSEEDYQNAEKTLHRLDFRADCIITHTAPRETARLLAASGCRKRCGREYKLQQYLDTVHRRVQYGHWYLGHFHRDEALGKQTVVFSTLLQLPAGRIVHQWKPYETGSNP